MRGDRDVAAVRDAMVALKTPERRARANVAQQAFERTLRDRPSAGWQAAAIEWVGTATARKLASDFWRIGFEPESYADIADHLYAVLVARGRAFFEAFARGVVRNDVGDAGWPLVRRAVREGLIEPPGGEDYLRRIVVNVGRRGAMRDLDATYAGLVADPDLLDREIWQLFEVDVGNELSNATTWEPPTAPGKPGSRGENRWLYALPRLASEGRLERSRLLDASLDALLRDFRASGVGWYVKLHEALEPTPEERVERLDRYLSLVTSPTPAVAREGLAALRRIEDAVPPSAFARVAPTPLSHRQKNLATETLSLLAALCKRHPDERALLIEAAAHALGHERTDVQERALTLLEQHPDDVPRASLLRYVEVVSPTLRARVESLSGVVTTPRAETDPARPPPPIHRPADVVLEAPLEPVETLDELIELAAMLLEGVGDGDDCERFLDGVSRLCDERPPGFERRTAGLAKRAEAAGYWGPMASGSELVGYVVRAWTGRRHRFERVAQSRTIMGFLVGRADEVARRAARRRPRALLAFPTSSGGAIDRAVLEERLRRIGRFRNRPDPLDEAQARARAFMPVEPLRFERRVEERSHWGRTTRHLRLRASQAPDGLGELGSLARNAGALEGGDRTWYGGSVGWAGFDRLGSAWALTVLPSLPEVAFAGAATLAVAARDASDTSSGHPEAALERALVRPRPLPPVAWLTVAACLVARSPGVTRVATDLLVASADDGRLDAAALGEEIAWLVDADFAKAGRLGAPLRDLARISSLHAAQTLRTVEAVLARLETRPHALHTLLEVAVESAAATGGRIENGGARSTLEAIAAEASRSSKLGRLARSLLET